MNQETCTFEEVIDFVETWLITGKLNTGMLAESFRFSSPFWKQANKVEFIAQFADPRVYTETALSKITHFDPVIQLQDQYKKHFAIVLQYHTRNGHAVYETVLGAYEQGYVTELISMYDLEETKKALELV